MRASNQAMMLLVTKVLRVTACRCFGRGQALCLAAGFSALAISSGSYASPPGPLEVSHANPRYFALPDGRPILLAGAHDGWELQDYAWGDANAPIRFQWKAFLDFLVDRNMNVIRLWCVESTKINDADDTLTEPMAYERVSGKGKANDGGNKFDLDRFNAEYFQRMEQRVDEAGERGLYVIVMLFQGWSIESKRGKVNPWPYHPYHEANNVNGLDGDVNADGQGKELHTWLGPDHPVTQRQRAYVRKVVDTVGRFDHVLYEIANESHNESIPWQSKMVEYLRELEQDRGKVHPIGMSVTFGDRPGNDLNRLLLESPADWISPNRFGGKGFSYRDNPPMADGTKVILSDTDHFFGNSGKDPGWPWKSVCRGLNLLYMDMWSVERDDPKRKLVRRSLGEARTYTERMNLAASEPRDDLASSRFCLGEPGRCYLVYAPNGGSVELELSDAPGKYQAEWYRPLSGETVAGGEVQGGGRRELKAPFAGDAVLFVERIEGDSQ